MTPANQQEVDRYWAAEMGVASEFGSIDPGVHSTIQQIYSGAQLFRRHKTIIIASPPHWAEIIAARVRGVAADQVFSVEFVRRLLCPEAEKVIGPAEVNYADRSMFHGTSTAGCRLLTFDDLPIRHTLADALSSAELEQSGFDPTESQAFGMFASGVLCACASYQIWQPKIAHITVATHPDFRRRGYAQAAVSALADQVLSQDLILQYRALESNQNSLKLGLSLGFKHYCSTIYARLPTV
jgi:RimJ/RimL family protein N-acetyltransferase